MWSAVMPDGPATAPDLAVLKHTRNSSGSKSNALSGIASATSWHNSSLATGGLLAGSVNILTVAMVPGTIGTASRAFLAADRARSQRLSSLSCWWRRLLLEDN